MFAKCFQIRLAGFAFSDPIVFQLLAVQLKLPGSVDAGYSTKNSRWLASSLWFLPVQPYNMGTPSYKLINKPFNKLVTASIS